MTSMDGTQDVYVNKSANSRLALNLSFNIITIFSLIYNKSRCDQREKKNSNKTADSLEENVFFKSRNIQCLRNRTAGRRGQQNACL